MSREELIVSGMRKIAKSSGPVIAAVDGRCAAGKSTLAMRVGEMLGCSVIHMDDFFLRPCQRTAERMSEAGGNIDYERFIAEVLEPLKTGLDFSYRPYCCKTGMLGEPVGVKAGRFVLIEGSYSCHPKFVGYYDLRYFLDVSYDEQLKRIELRNGAVALEKFKSTWIPMEEKYFEEFKIKETCEQL